MILFDFAACLNTHGSYHCVTFVQGAATSVVDQQSLTQADEPESSNENATQILTQADEPGGNHGHVTHADEPGGNHGNVTQTGESGGNRGNATQTLTQADEPVARQGSTTHTNQNSYFTNGFQAHQNDNPRGNSHGNSNDTFSGGLQADSHTDDNSFLGSLQDDVQMDYQLGSNDDYLGPIAGDFQGDILPDDKEPNTHDSVRNSTTNINTSSSGNATNIDAFVRVRNDINKNEVINDVDNMNDQTGTNLDRIILEGIERLARKYSSL